MSTKTTLRVGFAGTPVFAERALQAILNAGFEVVVALTQPDRPSGRGMQLTPSPVKQLALARNIPVEQPLSLRNAEAQAMLRAARDAIELHVLIKNFIERSPAVGRGSHNENLVNSAIS